MWNNACTIIQLIFGTVMCTLVMAQFIRDLLQVPGKWQLNRYKTLLIYDGLLYFLVCVLSLFFCVGSDLTY